MSAIPAFGLRKMLGAVGANGLSLESVEGLPAEIAAPALTQQRLGVAVGTAKAIPAGQSFIPEKHLRLAQSAPAIP